MLMPINLLPWQPSLHLSRQRRRWVMRALLLIFLLSVIGDGWLAYTNHRLQTDVHSKQRDLKRWQPVLQQWQKTTQQQRHLAEIKRWQQQWYCRWQTLLSTLPTEVSWQHVLFSFDHCQLQGRVEDPAVLNQWAKRLACLIHQQHVQRAKDSNLFDFDTDLTWP